MHVQSVYICGLTQHVQIGCGTTWQGCETNVLSLGPDVISPGSIRLTTVLYLSPAITSTCGPLVAIIIPKWVIAPRLRRYNPIINLTLEMFSGGTVKKINEIIFHAWIKRKTRPVFSYKMRYIVGYGLIEMAISTNPKPTIYRNLHENTGPGGQPIRFRPLFSYVLNPPMSRLCDWERINFVICLTGTEIGARHVTEGEFILKQTWW